MAAVSFFFCVRCSLDTRFVYSSFRLRVGPREFMLFQLKKHEDETSCIFWARIVQRQTMEYIPESISLPLHAMGSTLDATDMTFPIVEWAHFVPRTRSAADVTF